jgi:PAS domain S-box-containing protein
MRNIGRPAGEQFDVQQDRSAEAFRALSASDALGAVLERVPVGIIVVNAEGQLLLMNEVGRRISGAPPHERSAVEDQTGAYGLREPITGRPLDPQETPIAQAVAGNEVNGYEYTFRRPTDGNEVWVRVDAVPLRSGDGSIAGAVAVFYDVTQRRTHERQRDDFLSAAAHDLKSPLASIKGFAQLLRRNLNRRETVDREKILEGLDRIESTTARMTSLIGELLDATALQLDQPLDLRRRPTDLVALAERVVSDQQQTTDHHHLMVESAQEELTGEWDADRLERVLANLLSNAIKYTPEGGDIVVRVDCERDGGQDWAVLEVQDCGLGIPAADLPHIFERFRRGRNVTGEIAGTGIGLSGSKQIVEQHGGTIRVASREGVGSTFTIRLPLSAPPALDQQPDVV